MLRSVLRFSTMLGVSVASAACIAEVDPEEVATGRAALTADDSDASALAVGDAFEVEMVGRSIRKAFELRLGVEGRIELATEPVRGDRPVATSLALYRDASSKRRPLARAEDPEGRLGVRVEHDLLAGRYRVVVKGSSQVRGGAFRLSATQLQGPDENPSCLFGSQFSELRSNPALVLAPDEWITSATQLSHAHEGEQLVLAVQQSSHTDVTTVEEALARVDQNEVRRIVIDHVASGDQFVVYEYGAGDNSYGAIFEQATTRLIAAIHDGDLLNCTRPAS